MRTHAAKTGTKGAAEGGIIGGVGAIVCAVADAVRPLGIDVRQCPVSPEVLFKLAGAAARREQR